MGRKQSEETRAKIAATLRKPPHRKVCVWCGCTFETKKKVQRLCSRVCSVAYRNQQLRDTPKHVLSARGGQATIGRHHTEITNIFECRSKTMSKIIERLGIGCSNCGWNQAHGDVHHIHGRQISDPHNHNNISYLCPNCHRLAHRGILSKEDLVTFEQQVGNRWRKHYYG